MKQAIVIHGAYGYPNENWFPWLKVELEKLGFETAVPKFPTPNGQEPGTWLSVLDGAMPKFSGDTIMIGHSIGCALILRKLELLRQPIRAAFLVSGFLGRLDNQRFDQLNRSFFSEPFDWKKIRRNCPAFFVYHGDDDPYVPVERGRELSGLLDAELRIVGGGGHINEASGFTRFDALLKDIKAVCAVPAGQNDEKTENLKAPNFKTGRGHFRNQGRRQGAAV